MNLVKILFFNLVLVNIECVFIKQCSEYLPSMNESVKEFIKIFEPNITYECFEDSINKGVERHVVKLMSKLDFIEPYKLSIQCMTCGANASHFKWVRLDKKMTDLEQLNPWSVYNEFKWIDVISELNPILGEYTPCFDNSTNELVFHLYELSSQTGTYMCGNSDQKNHTSNRIWFHLDYIESINKSIYRFVTFPNKLNKIHKVVNYDHLKRIHSKMATKFNRINRIRNNSFLVWLDKNNLTEDIPCGMKVTIREERNCFIKLPYLIRTHDLFELAIKEAFGYFFEPFFNDDTSVENVDINFLKKSARYHAKNFNFELYYDRFYFYLPCTYTLFHRILKYKTAINLYGSQFYIYSLFNYTLKCSNDDINPLDLVNMVLQRDIASLKMEAGGVQDKRFMKIEKIAVENSENFMLDCQTQLDTIYQTNNTATDDHNNNNKTNSNETHPILKPYVFMTRCVDDYLDVKWFDTDGHMYFPQTAAKEHIYVDENCRLVFRKIQFHYANVYSCYRKKTKTTVGTSSKWNDIPFLSYQLRVTQAYYNLPKLEDILIGLTILTIWTFLVILAWFVVSIYYVEQSEKAHEIACARLDKLEKKRQRSKILK